MVLASCREALVSAVQANRGASKGVISYANFGMSIAIIGESQAPDSVFTLVT